MAPPVIGAIVPDLPENATCPNTFLGQFSEPFGVGQRAGIGAGFASGSHPQIKTLTEVARECPDVRIVLNHFGGPLAVGRYKRDEVFPGWRADIEALSGSLDAFRRSAAV